MNPRLKLAVLLVAPLLALLLVLPGQAQPACVTFEPPLALGTTYGAPVGQSSGDLAFVSSGISAYVFFERRCCDKPHRMDVRDGPPKQRTNALEKPAMNPCRLTTAQISRERVDAGQQWSGAGRIRAMAACSGRRRFVMDGCRRTAVPIRLQRSDVN